MGNDTAERKNRLIESVRSRNNIRESVVRASGYGPILDECLAEGTLAIYMAPVGIGSDVKAPVVVLKDQVIIDCTELAVGTGFEIIGAERPAARKASD